MKISTRSSYGLEITIESENTKITESVSRGLYSKTVKNGLGLPYKEREEVDTNFKEDIHTLLIDIYDIEKRPTDEILSYFWERCNGSEKEDFINSIIEELNMKELENYNLKTK